MEKSKKSINMEDGFLFFGGWNFSKSVSVGPTFIREMRVHGQFFFICNAQGQKFANSESCLCLKLLKEAKIHNLPKNEDVGH